MNGSARPSGPRSLGRLTAYLATLLLVLAFVVTACSDLQPVGPGTDPPPVEEPDDPPGTDDPDDDPDDPGDGRSLGTWTAATPSGEPRQEVSYVEVGGRFYLAGGSTAHEVYDPRSDTWTTLDTRLPWRDHIQGVAIGPLIYYIGGIVQWPDDDRDTVLIYDTRTDTLADGAPMPVGRGAGGIAAHDGLIYYAGGLHEGTATDRFDVYDPEADAWTPLAPMPHARDHFHAAMVDGRFYAIGGRDTAIDATLDAVDVYDVATDRWTTLDTALPTPRGGFATAVIGDEILVIGGEGGGTTFDTVEAYDTTSNSWRTLTPMAAGRHGIQAAVCAGTVYVAAGGLVQGGGSKTSAHEVFALEEPRPCPDPLDTFVAIEWRELPEFDPFPRAEGQGTLVGDDLYVFGGFRPDWDEYCTTKLSHVLNTTDLTWRQLGPGLRDWWTHSGLVVDGDRIHFAGMRLQGGRVDETDAQCEHWEIGTTEVWTFDTVTETWSNTLPSLPDGRSSGGFAIIDRTLHFFGGSNANTTDESGDHWALDLDDVAAGWTDRSPLPNPRNHMGVVALDGYIYAVGGQWGNGAPNVPQDDVHRYDSESDAWTEVASLPTAQSHIASTITVGSRIVVFGGEQLEHGNPVHDVLAYDPASDAWTNLTPLPVDPNRPDFGSRAGVVGFVDGEIYYVRGEHTTQAYRGTPVIDW